MVVGSVNDRNKVFHYPNCKYTIKIKADNIIYFKNKEDAINHGYRQCKCCSYILKYYKLDKNKIDKFLIKNNLKMYIEDDSMFIDNMFSAWKITIENNNLVLYHANSESYNKLKVKNGHLIHHYHLQKYKDERNILSMLEYIINHDEWKIRSLDNYKKLPKKTKNQKKKYKDAERNAERIKNRNLYNLLDKISIEMKQNDKISE